MNRDLEHGGQPTPTPLPKPWFLYLLRCRGNKLYAGITTDVARRFHAHCTGKGAKFTRANPPLEIIGSRPFIDRSSASVAEAAIKRLPAPRKLLYISHDHAHDL